MRIRLSPALKSHRIASAIFVQNHLPVIESVKTRTHQRDRIEYAAGSSVYRSGFGHADRVGVFVVFEI